MEIIAAISGSALLNVFIWVAVAAAIWYLGSWALAKLNLGDPFSKLATGILVVLVVILIANALFSLTSQGPFIRF